MHWINGILILSIAIFRIGAANSAVLSVNCHDGGEVQLQVLNEFGVTSSRLLSRPSGTCSGGSNNTVLRLDAECGFVPETIYSLALIDLLRLGRIRSKFDHTFLVSCSNALTDTATEDMTIFYSTQAAQMRVLQAMDPVDYMINGKQYTIELKVPAGIRPAECAAYSGNNEVHVQPLINEDGCSVYGHATGITYSKDGVFHFGLIAQQLNNLTELHIQCRLTGCGSEGECYEDKCSKTSSDFHLPQVPSYVLISTKVAVYRSIAEAPMALDEMETCSNGSSPLCLKIMTAMLSLLTPLVWLCAWRNRPADMKISQLMLRFRVSNASASPETTSQDLPEKSYPKTTNRTVRSMKKTLMDTLSRPQPMTLTRQPSPDFALPEYLSINELIEDDKRKNINLVMEQLPEPPKIKLYDSTRSSPVSAISDSIMETLPDPPTVTIQELKEMHDHMAASRRKEVARIHDVLKPQKPMEAPPPPPVNYSQNKENQNHFPPMATHSAVLAQILNVDRCPLVKQGYPPTYVNTPHVVVSRVQEQRCSIRSRPLPPVPLPVPVPRVRSVKDLSVDPGVELMSGTRQKSPTIHIDDEMEFSSDTMDHPTASIVAAHLRNEFLRLEVARPAYVLANGDQASQL